MAPAAAIEPLLRLLDQMRKTVERIDDVDYATPAPGRTSGGIGAHVRHCLDHVAALVTATRSGVCAYDRRKRGTDVETCRVAAVAQIDELSQLLAGFDGSVLDEPLLVETQIDPAGTMILTRSSVGREVAFVVSHTIHHNALVGQMLAARGVPLDARFGVAPATPSETRTLACAP